MSGAAVFKPGSTALISGAASGIGLAIAKLCKGKGMNVAMLDRNVEALDKAKAAVAETGSSDAKVEAIVVDVSKIDAWESAKKQILGSFGSVEFLVLNAGMGMKGGWGDHDYFRTTLETNLFGMINGLNVFLDSVKEASKSKPTAIVMTGSKQGITNPPGNPAYNASKAAVKSLAEQLSYDLKATSTSVHLLVPGWTYTGLTAGANPSAKPAGAWTAEQVAEYLEKRMKDNQFWVMCPDNDVSEDTDKRRMLWSVGDIVKGRQPLSRWRDEYKEEASETMAKMQL